MFENVGQEEPAAREFISRLIDGVEVKKEDSCY
jgi:hypothetical protein